MLPNLVTAHCRDTASGKLTWGPDTRVWIAEWSASLQVKLQIEAMDIWDKMQMFIISWCSFRGMFPTYLGGDLGQGFEYVKDTDTHECDSQVQEGNTWQCICAWIVNSRNKFWVIDARPNTTVKTRLHIKYTLIYYSSTTKQEKTIDKK